MNNWDKGTIKLILALVILISITITIFFVAKTREYTYFNEKSLLNKIIETKWYSIPSKNTYESLEFFGDRSLNYIYYDKMTNNGLLTSCTNYLYSSKDNEIKLLCDDEIKKITINYYDKDKLLINIDGINKVFYTTIDMASN